MGNITQIKKDGVIITVATFGVGSPAAAIVAAATISTGATMTYAAATDSALVMDVSVTTPTGAGTYQKYGGSVVLDFEDDNAQFYARGGNGEGYGSGMSYSAGLVDNYDSPEDYSGPFLLI